MSYGGASPDVLMELEVPVVTKETCTTAMASFATITDDMICAGGVEGQDSCQVGFKYFFKYFLKYSKYFWQGDSGGPLTYKSGAQHVLIGDTSFGEQCALAGKYGVYGRISYFRTWIEGKMTSPSYCGSSPDADA